MLEEALTALAAAGGTAVVQAAGTDAWTGFRAGLARIFSRGDDQRQHAELERLNHTAEMLEEASDAELELVRSRQEGAWQGRFEVLLENLEEPERQQAVDELRALLAEFSAPASSVSVGSGGLAAGRDIKIRGGKDGITAGTVHGGININSPRRPDSSQGWTDRLT
jgi:hypothetical protein